MTDLLYDNLKSDAAGQFCGTGLYDPRNDHDSCGTGFIVNLAGTPDHALVEKGIGILSNLEHRCAIGADGKTGDGAGLMLQIPDTFFRKVSSFSLPRVGKYAVGQLFLPRNVSDLQLCMTIVRETVEREGCCFLGERDVETDFSYLGEIAARSVPVFKQIFVSAPELNENEFVRRLYVIRRSVEKKG